MGTIIGRQGLKIKHIQDMSNSRMTASKEMLPQSTERVVEIQGTVEAVRLAVIEVGKCIVEDWERGIGTVLYNPVVRLGLHGKNHTIRGYNVEEPPRRGSADKRGNDVSQFKTPNPPSPSYHQRTERRFPSSATETPRSSSSTASQKTEQISIPSDMVGCIIGKGGAKIADIRRQSGSRISIAKNPHNESGERMFTITGTTESNERALNLLYNQLGAEKERRSNGIMSRNRESDDEISPSSSRVSK
jgi:heterogeneous nuclear rnp K-like protein 2